MKPSPKCQRASLAVLILLAVPSYVSAQDTAAVPDTPTAAQDTYGPNLQEGSPPPIPTPIAIPEELQRAAQIASETHPTVEGAKAETEALESEYQGARWLRYPSLSVEALSATRGSTIADSDGLALNASIEQPLWAGGRISGEIDLARANRNAGNSRLGEAQNDITLRVVEAYYDVALAEQRVRIIETSLDEHRRLLESINRRVTQEISPRTDLILGQTRTAQVELELATAEEEKQSAEIRLANLTGLSTLRPVLPPLSVSDTLPAEDVALADALACSPHLSTLRDLVDAAEAQKDIARAQLLPQVLLQLSQNEITGARAAIVFRAQTGNGLRTFSAIDSSDARIRSALADFGETERLLRAQLRREYVLVRAAKRRVEAGTLAAETSAKVIASYERQFAAGRRSWLDVMNAVRETTSARNSETDARVAVASASARILLHSCRWKPTQLLDPQSE